MILASFMNLCIHKRSKITQSFDKKNFSPFNALLSKKKPHFHEAFVLVERIAQRCLEHRILVVELAARRRIGAAIHLSQSQIVTRLHA